MRMCVEFCGRRYREKMGERYDLKQDLLPISATVIMECVNVGLNTLFKAATLRGMNYHVFIVYDYAIAALVGLLPAPFLRRRSTVLPPLNFSILSKIGVLGVLGFSCQIMGYTGLTLTSPTLSSAISSVVPAFTFILAIIFRMEKVVLRSKSSQAKILGTIISITGAFVVTLYKGSPIVIVQPSPSLLLHQSLLNNAKSNWVIGGLLLSAGYMLYPPYYIVQAQIMKEYPSEVTVIFFYNVCVCVLATIFALIVEKDSSAWKLRPDIGLISVACSGVFGSFLNNTAHAWAMRLKGPVFVAMFKPLSIAIAVAMGFIFLGDTLHIGSLVGAVIISVGFYTVMWGKAKEDMDESPRTHKDNVPLLH